MLLIGLLPKLQCVAGLLLASIHTAFPLSLTATHSRQFLFPLPRPTPPDLLPGNFPARLRKPLRNAGGLNFKERLLPQESELV